MKSNIMKIVATLLITAVVMSALGMGVYSIHAKPKFYTQFVDLGNKYLLEEKYEEAIVEFSKAIKIEARSTEARVGKAKGYIGLGDIESAISCLKEAQDLDITNEELLLEIIYLIKDIAPKSAYEILLKYVDAVGIDNISKTIRELLDSANEMPVMPIAKPAPGIYVKPVDVRFISDKARLGHAYYYTTDDSEPTETSPPYKLPFAVNGHLVIKLIGYSPTGEYTEVGIFEYDLDESMLTELERILSESQDTYDNTETGEEPGNCVEGAKEELELILEECKNVVNKPILTYDEAHDAFEKMNEALYMFREKIIVPTDRVELQKNVNTARQLYDDATEGNNEVGSYRSGSKAKIKEVLDSSTIVLEDVLSRQEQIDEAKDNLSEAIDAFKASRITETDKIFIDAGAKVGKVTVSLLWNTTDDLDLHVTNPRGNTIYYGNSSDSFGGRLDVDRQVSTYVVNPIENIYWDNPPSGTYTVKVNVFSKRTEGETPIKVRVIVNGEAKIYDLSVNTGMNNVCTFTF